MYQVKLEQFEGPLDLLLSLIEDQKFDICEISLANITSQYLDYLNHFQIKDPTNLADFLVVASRLILIKSRTLLPFLELDPEEEKDIEELKKRLEEYKKFKKLAQLLRNLTKQNKTSHSRESFLNLQVFFFPPPDLSAQSLYLAFQKTLEKIEKTDPLPEKTIIQIISIEDKIKKIRERIIESVAKFSEIIKESSKIEMIVSFLALLELIKQRFVVIDQSEIFGEITISKSASVLTLPDS